LRPGGRQGLEPSARLADGRAFQKHVGRIYAELRHLRGIGRDGIEMLGNVTHRLGEIRAVDIGDEAEGPKSCSLQVAFMVCFPSCSWARISGRIHLSGFVAWLAWAIVHLMFLPQLQNRMRVQTQWLWSYFTGQRSSRLIAEVPRGPTTASSSSAAACHE
jgi:hypothetical protein